MSDDVVFSVADDGTTNFGELSSNPLTIGNFGMERAIGYYFSTASGNIQLIPSGIVHLNAPVGINTATVGSNKLRVSGSVRFDLGSDAVGDIFYRNASGNFTRLPVASNGDVLTLASGIPGWAPPGSASLPAGSMGDMLVHNGTSYVSLSPIVETQSGIVGTGITLAAAPLAYAPVTIYKNGQYLIVTDDYSFSGTALTMVDPLLSTDKITAIYYI